MTWQNIDTAPKNTDVLVAVCDKFWNYRVGVAMYHTYAYKSGGWWQWEWEYEPNEISPTHWMPLPDPPGTRDA